MRKKLLSCLLTLCMLFSLLPTAALAADANPFTDVKDADWFYDGVLWVKDEGLMNGTTATTFAPNDTTTRGMLVTILWRLAGKPDAKGTQFSDVDDGAYYADATIWGCANDIICGYGDGTFGPNDAITRQQMATILYRYAKYAKYDVTAAADLSDYDDADEVASWAEDALAWANAEGLINGMGDDTLAPAGNATRAQVAAILYRMTKLSPAKEETKPSTSGGSSSGGSSHTHDWVWTSNQDGTHSAVCSKNSSHTKAAEDCNLHGYKACTVCGYTDSKYHIANVDDLLAFADYVNADTTDKFAFEGETAVLDADIDMTGRTWTPIEKVFNGTFDGQGNTISNLTIKGTEKVGFFGSAWLASEIKDVNFETVTVTGNHFVGTVVGSTYGTVSGCSVTDLAMTVEPNLKDDGVTYDNGDKVGGIAGYSACGEITDCSVTDATISAYRDVGGILGASIKDNINTTVTDCTVENVIINVNQDGEKNYGTKAPNAGGIVGRVDGSVDTTSCTQTNVTINVTLDETEADKVAMVGNTTYATLEAAAKAAIAGQTIVLLDDVTLTEQVVLAAGVTLDGNNKSVDASGLAVSYDCAITTLGGTVKNLTITGDSGKTRAIGAGSSGTYSLTQDLYIDNVTIDNVLYGINGSGTAKIVVTNSTIYGWDSFSGISSFEFENCTLGKGDSYLGYIPIYGDTTFTDCTFVDFDMCARSDVSATVTFTNCTNDGEEVTPANFQALFMAEGDETDFGYLVNNCDVVIDGVYYAASAAKLASLIEKYDEATIALAGTEYTTTEAISVGGGKNITIQGVEGTRLTTWFKVTADLKLQKLTLASPSTAVPGETTSQYKYSTISLMNEGDVVCENVTFDMGEAVADATAISAWWSTGTGANITVTDCTFLCAGNRPIRSDACVTVEKCTFYNPYRYAVQLTSKASTATGIKNAVVNFNNNTIVGGDASDKPVYGIQLEGEVYGCGNLIINGEGNEIVKTTRDTAMYYCECGKVEHATIVWNTIDADPVHASAVAEGVLKVDGTKTYEITSKAGLLNLDSVLAEADLGEGKGATVNLMVDVDLTGETWTPITRMWVTFNGNNKTISNLNCGTDSIGRSGFWGYAGAVTINDLTLENVTSCGSQAGTFAGSAEALKLNNCTLKGENTVSYQETEETYNGIGAICGFVVEDSNSTLNATIDKDATVTLYYNDMTSVAEYVDTLTGYNGTNAGTITNNGEVIAVVADGYAVNNDVYEISNAAGMFYFAKQVNEEGKNFKGETVKLVDDIDLNNEAWTPIGQTGATEFKGVFDGDGYTISNLNVDSSTQTGEHYSSGLFGWAEAYVTIQNVKVDGATVKGNHNVAVIVGYTYSAKITNCHVSNATITCTHANEDACGDKAGIIGGYVADESEVTNCSATECSVTAGRDAGQLVGTGYAASLIGCEATNVTVTAGDDCTGANVNKALIGRVMG